MIAASEKHELLQSVDLPRSITGRIGGACQKKKGLLIPVRTDKLLGFLQGLRSMS
jgi:hypothetical protein